jgi:hypothetical protein
MNAIGELFRKSGIDRSMALDAVLAGKSGGDHVNAEVRFTAVMGAASVTCMSGVLVRFVDHIQSLWRKCAGQLFGHSLAYGPFTWFSHWNASCSKPNGQRPKSQAI